MVRIGDRRFLSRRTPFDAVMGFILASMLARAVNGSASLVPTIVGGFAIVLLHRGLATLSSRFHSLGDLIKGRSDQVVKDGAVIEENLRSNGLSKGDLLEDMRLNGRTEDISHVKTAFFERNGDISVLSRD